MASDTDRHEFSLRSLFESVIDLAPEKRAARIASLTIPHHDRTLLHAMVAFQDIIEERAELREEMIAAMDLSEEVRIRLRAMIAADSLTPSVANAIASEVTASLHEGDDLARSLIGTNIGGFHLVDLLGQGGSSIVFRAKRDAGDGEQVVALKLMRSGLYSTDARRRFRREQGILAKLVHPNIARFIEGGVSSVGIPYIAMELVDGIPLTEAANMRSLTLEQRLVWFSNLCRTMMTAHAALIVHRDLKPSNILVTKQGSLKVLDFGIAKLADSEDELQTKTKSIALTPEYAAPEQLRGAQLTTSVDVFSLGVVLGELITGNRLRGNVRASSSLSSVNSQIPKGLPNRDTLAGRLRGDLDAILANALAEEPPMRYASAEALADDIDRYLAGRPVRAYPPSRWYRVRKFVGRHRTSIVASGVLGGALFLTSAIAVWQGAEAIRAANAAQAQAARADSMRSFMFDAFAQAEPAVPRNGPITVVEVVERAITTASNDKALDPRARADVLSRLAEVVGAQGNLERSGELLARSFDDAKQFLGVNDRLTFEISRLLERNHYLRGSYAIARQEADVLLKSVPESMTDLRVALLRDSAAIASRVRNRTRAVAESQLAMELSESSGKPDQLLESLNTQAVVLLSVGELEASIAAFQRVLQLNRARFGEQSEQVAGTLTALSRAYRRFGALDRAESSVRSALEIDKVIYPSDHWITSLHLNALGAVLIAKRDFYGAKEAYTECLRIDESTRGLANPDYAIDLQAIAYIEMQIEDYNQASAHLKSAFEKNITHFGERHWRTAVVRADYGYSLAMAGRERDGLIELERAIADLQALPDPDAYILAKALDRKIHLSLRRGQPNVALDDLKRLQQLAEAGVKDVEHRAFWAGRVDCIQGEIFLAMEQPQNAIEPLLRCEGSIDREKDTDPVLRTEQALLLSAAFKLLGNTADARVAADKGRDRLQHLKFPTHHLMDLEAAIGH